MSQILINAYLSELDRIKRVSGSLSEQVVSEAFKDLLKAWSRQQGLVFLAQQGLTSNQKTAIRPDGTILHDLRGNGGAKLGHGSGGIPARAAGLLGVIWPPTLNRPKAEFSGRSPRGRRRGAFR